MRSIRPLLNELNFSCGRVGAKNKKEGGGYRDFEEVPIYKPSFERIHKVSSNSSTFADPILRMHTLLGR
jgi:hypothetical protein